VLLTLFQIALLLLETVIPVLFFLPYGRPGADVVKDMRIKVYNKILGLNLAQFDKTPIGTLTPAPLTTSNPSTIFSPMADTHYRRFCFPSSP